ncbi:MAG: 2'-5' RNA ligase family protein [candidate division Zixibacteria bacterium]|nr:2'-5' RNA ligase family protein [candidate division Zixibacteria bacterium]
MSEKSRIWVVSMLEGGQYDKVKKIWRMFERKFGFVGVNFYYHPHVTYQGGTTNDLRGFRADFEKLLLRLEPFRLQVSGLANFNKKVIYLAVKETKKLCFIHRKIHSLMDKYCDDLDPLYAPGNWTPHATLVMEDLTEENFDKAWREINRNPMSFKQTISNYCIVKLYGKKAKNYKAYTINR